MNPRPKQLSGRDNAGNIVEGKFLKSSADGKADYDVLLETDLSQKLVKRGQYTLIKPVQNSGNEARVLADGVDLEYSFTNNNVSTTSGVSGAPLFGTALGVFVRASTQAVALQVAGWARSGSPVFSINQDLRSISKWGTGLGFTTFVNFAWGLALDLALAGAVANPPTSAFIGVQFLNARDINYQFVVSDGVSQTVVDTGVAPSANPQYLEMDIADDATSVRFILRDLDFVVVADETITTNIPAASTTLSPIGALQTTGAITRQIETFFFLVDNAR